MKAILVGCILSFCTAANASYLRLVPTITYNIDETRQSVEIVVSVINEGDEPAHEVELELPTLNQRHLFSKELQPNGSSQVKLKFSYADLGMSQKGDYGLIYRLLYKDSNFYPFSAPYVLRLVIPPAPSVVLSGYFADAKEGGGVKLSDETETKLIIKNSLHSGVQVEKIELLAPVEIEAMLATPVSPFSLKVGEEKALHVVFRKTNALIGSTYRMGALASGTLGDRHFIHEYQVMVTVVEGGFNTRNMIGIIMAALTLIAVFGWFWKNKNAKQ